MITLYGIPNCGSMKKARAWLAGHGVEYGFHDYKRDGLDPARLHAWVAELGWETLLNRRGQTWRRLDPAVRAAIDAASAIEVMLANPSIIRRPLLDTGTQRLVGFDPTEYAQVLTP